MGGNLKLMRLFGIPLELNGSWFFVLALVVLSLATQVLPGWQPGLSLLAYWLLGVLAALAFFACLVLHELAHALMSRRFGQPVARITLFLFGGVSESKEEMVSPKAEFWIAVVGPLTSLVLAGVLFGLGLGAEALGAPPVLARTLGWLGVLNFALALFNLLPGFPLDGGRLLRAGLWAWRRDLRQATRWASWGGQACAGALMAVGLLRLFSGAWLGGFWLIALGWLLGAAARQSEVQVTLKQALERLRVADLMSREPQTLPPGMSLREAVEEHFMRFNYGGYPVVEDGRVLGMLDRAQVRRVPTEAWARTRVAEVMAPLEALAPPAPGTAADQALSAMAKGEVGRLPVLEGGALVGVLSQTDVMRYLMWLDEPPV